MPLPFQDIQDSSIARIINMCPTATPFIQRVNDATRRLLRRGDWENVDIPIFNCVRNGCVVWPRYVGHVRKINYCNQPIDVENMWFRFLPGDRCGRDMWMGWRGEMSSVRIDGVTPVFQDIQGDGRLIRAYARCRNDWGKTIQFFGKDNNGSPLQERQPDGTWTMGQTLTLQSPFASTSVFVRSIDYVIKQETQCPVDCYAYNATTNLLEDLAHYEPGETNPSYQRTNVNIFWSQQTPTGSFTPGCCSTVRGVLAMVKLKFIPVKYPTDLCIIDNIDALKLMCQAIAFEEASDRENARQYEADAIEVLNRGLEEMIPDYQFTATVNILGTRTRGNKMF